jgi:hypothetical protein
MSKLNTKLHESTAKSLGVYQAATMDGYWEDAAMKDLQYVFLLGQLHATKSMHSSSLRDRIGKMRIKWLTKEIEELDVRLESPEE